MLRKKDREKAVRMYRLTGDLERSAWTTGSGNQKAAVLTTLLAMACSGG